MFSGKAIKGDGEGCWIRVRLGRAMEGQHGR